MPSVPKFVGDFIEKTFASRICKVKLLSIEMAAQTVKIITFQGVFPHVNFKTGQAISIRVDETNFRNYTPSRWSSASGTFEVVFHLHKGGPGSRFIEDLEPDDELTVGLPRGFGMYNQDATYQFYFGDETCLGLFKSLKDQANNDDKNYLGIAELDEISMKVPHEMGIEIDSVPKSSDRAAHAIEALNKMDAKLWNLWKDGYFYLLGNARSIQNFRKALREKGVPGRNIYTKPYWADGKTGL